MTIDKADQERFEQLLPGLACNRLDAADLEWLKEFVAAHPKMARQMDIERELRNVLRAEMPDNPVDRGVVPFMARIRADGGATSSSLLNRFLENFRTSLAVPMVKPAWAMLVTLVVVQTGIIVLQLGASGGSGRLVGEPESAQWRSVGTGPAAARGSVLQLTFKPAATEAEIRLLLVKIGGSIVAGPGQLGHYVVRLADQRAEAAAQQLQGQEILVAVEVLPDVPSED